MHKFSRKFSQINPLTLPDSIVRRPSPFCRATAVARYSITDLGVLGTYKNGVSGSRAYGINNNSQVVGDSSTNSDEDRAFLWDSTTGMQDLGILGAASSYRYSVAYGINDNSQVVGISVSSDNSPILSFAFLWEPTMGMQDLGVLGVPNNRYSEAYAINNKGQIVGNLRTSNNSYYYFLWDKVTGMQNLSDFGDLGSLNDHSSLLNNKGQIVGSLTKSNDNLRAFLWDSTTGMQELGVLGTRTDGLSASVGNGINDNSQVVGASTTNNSDEGHACLWDSTTETQDLGVLGTFDGETFSEAYDINNKGQVVGISTSSKGKYRPFLWENGLMSDLNNLIDPDSGWVLYEANAINDLGQIVGSGAFNGQGRAFLLTPQ